MKNKTLGLKDVEMDDAEQPEEEPLEEDEEAEEEVYRLVPAAAPRALLEPAAPRAAPPPMPPPPPPPRPAVTWLDAAIADSGVQLDRQAMEWLQAVSLVSKPETCILISKAVQSRKNNVSAFIVACCKNFLAR